VSAINFRIQEQAEEDSFNPRQPQPKRDRAQHHEAAEGAPKAIVAEPFLQRDGQCQIREKRDQHAAHCHAANAAGPGKCPERIVSTVESSGWVRLERIRGIASRKTRRHQ
jgi:hypothetical protein